MLIDLCFCLVFFLIRLGRIGPQIRPKTKVARRGPQGPRRPDEAGLGLKKTCLLNRPGLGSGGRPAGWVRASKNYPKPNPLPFLASI